MSVNAEDNADVKIKNAISDYLANNFLNATFVFCNDDDVIEIGAKGFHRLYDQYLKAKQKMPVASITKTITAAGILRLRDKKLLNISDSVAKLLPSDSGVWKDGKVPNWANKVTLHHLLTHTSGLTEYFMNMPINLEQAHQQINMDITEFVANKKLKFTPGAKYEYVNTNYVIAGLIIETISKRPLADFFCEEFFQPLGMKYTKLASLEEAVKFQQDPSSTEYPTRYFVTPADKPQFNEATADYIMIPYADGGVISNITDLILWHKALHNGKILSPSSYKLMTTKHYNATSKFSNKNYVGYGLFISKTDNGDLIYFHSGSAIAIRAESGYIPAKNLYFAVISNVMTYIPENLKDKIDVTKPENQLDIIYFVRNVLNRLD
ncbi:MAG: beta-lactamase family protein [Rickettsiaceae bacterium]|nr:beta-lactamase family protein [Rickettsiaceae bacterium]